MTGSSLKVALVGAGSMGSNHLRNLRSMDGVGVTMVIEHDARIRERLATQGLTVADDIEKLLVEDVDAVVVAVPTRHHADVAVPLLEAGIPCLVEKPLAGTVQEARAITTAALRGKAILQVGHIERHNPAVGLMHRLVRAGEIGTPLSFNLIRTGPMPRRIGDVGVLLDLVSHDLDILCWITGEAPEHFTVDAFGWTSEPRREAGVHITARFPSGPFATIDASWLHPSKTRQLHCLGSEGLATVDYLQQEVYFARNDYEHRDWGPLQGLTGVSEGEQIRYRLARTEPLRAELESFFAAVRGEAPPAVTGDEGVATVEMLEHLLRLLNPGGAASLRIA